MLEYARLSKFELPLRAAASASASVAGEEGLVAFCVHYCSKCERVGGGCVIRPLLLLSSCCGVACCVVVFCCCVVAAASVARTSPSQSACAFAKRTLPLLC